MTPDDEDRPRPRPAPEPLRRPPNPSRDESYRSGGKPYLLEPQSDRGLLIVQVLLALILGALVALAFKATPVHVVIDCDPARTTCTIVEAP